MPDVNVLVLASHDDPAVDAVVAELRHRDVPVVRVDPDYDDISVLGRIDSSIPEWLGELRAVHYCSGTTSFDGLDGEHSSGTGGADRGGDSDSRSSHGAVCPGAGAYSELAFSYVRSVWCPGPPGWWRHHPWGPVVADLHVPWVNHPGRALAASLAHQLAAAAVCGLRVPETRFLTHRDDNDVSIFLKLFGSAVVRAIGEHPHGPRLLNSAQAAQAAQAEAGQAEAGQAPVFPASRSALVLQAVVARSHDVRVTVIGDELHAAATWGRMLTGDGVITPQGPEIVVDDAVAPLEVADAIRRLMAALGLAYAELDFVVDPQGRWWFLGLNPTGTGFARTETDSGLPLTTAMAEFLGRVWHDLD